jgi:flagellar hook assembly protein FlgD
MAGEAFTASPNPFTESTNINFNLSSQNSTKIEVLDMNGKLTTTLFEGVLDAGKHQLNWNGRDNSGILVKNGVYFVRHSSGREVKLIKIIKMD